MKQFTSLTAGIALLFGSLFYGCTKADINASAKENNITVQAKGPAPSKILYVEAIGIVAEGQCLTWKVPKRCNNPPWCNTCASVATSDVAMVLVKDWVTGLTVTGVIVTGNWSGGYSLNGVYSKTISDNTGNYTGYAFIDGLNGYTSHEVFTVTGLTVSGGVYDASKNIVSSAAIR